MTTQNERKATVIPNMCGGKGEVIIDYLLDDAQLNKKAKMFANVTIKPNCSLGYHEHHGETETYYIISGKGNYDDNGTTIPVKAGDVTFCKDGNGHALENTGNEDLVFAALIL